MLIERIEFQFLTRSNGGGLAYISEWKVASPQLSTYNNTVDQKLDGWLSSWPEQNRIGHLPA